MLAFSERLAASIPGIRRPEKVWPSTLRSAAAPECAEDFRCSFPASSLFFALTYLTMERTLILLKPDTLKKAHVGDVIQRFEAQGFQIAAMKMLQLTDALLTEHYSHIASKPFFPEVATFMSSTPVVALVLEGDNVIDRTRELLGPTDSTQAAKGTIRGDYGVDKMVNVAHASDSQESAAAEIQRFFKAEELFEYKR